MTRSVVQICNEAISDLPAHPIADINDSSKEARECSRHLPGVVSDLIDYHDFSFVRRRQALAVVANDRAAEWSYAYALPDEWVSAVKLVPTYTTTGTPEVVVTPILYWPNVDMTIKPINYEIANAILYTNLEEAVLEYTTDALEPTKWPPLFAQAVIRSLAARIYRPILGEKADTNEWLAKQAAAQRALNEAVASDLNRNPRQRKSFVPEGQIARQAAGYGDVVWRR